MNKKNMYIFFTLTKSSTKANNAIMLHVFSLWNTLLSSNFLNMNIGVDFSFFTNQVKKRYRYTYSGSPHAQTKKGRDFIISNTKLSFGIKIKNPILFPCATAFIKFVLLQYKSLQSGLKIQIKL